MSINIKRQKLRQITLYSLGLASLMGVLLFYTKHKVRTSLKELSTIQKQILTTKEAIHVLKAEWSHLNSPKRLESLSYAHLQLKSIGTVQVASLANLPSSESDGIASPTVLASAEVSRNG